MYPHTTYGVLFYYVVVSYLELHRPPHLPATERKEATYDGSLTRSWGVRATTGADGESVAGITASAGVGGVVATTGASGAAATGMAASSCVRDACTLSGDAGAPFGADDTDESRNTVFTSVGVDDTRSDADDFLPRLSFLASHA